ncbi:transposase [Streptomyces capoamus]|uniref:transposase n=1 Tax=Streptomyces capoamus TaxID=68183 RepID=UPI00339B5F22
MLQDAPAPEKPYPARRRTPSPCSATLEKPPCAPAREKNPSTGRGRRAANCHAAVSIHAATDTASCPLERQLYLPRERTDQPDRCRRAGDPDGRGAPEK